LRHVVVVCDAVSRCPIQIGFFDYLKLSDSVKANNAIDTESLEDCSCCGAFHDISGDAIGLIWLVEKSIHFTNVAVGLDKIYVEHLTYWNLFQESLDRSCGDGIAVDCGIVGICHPDGFDSIVLGIHRVGSTGIAVGVSVKVGSHLIIIAFDALGDIAGPA
jgi:hypothetical protein